jgi:phosphopantetheinyl transferase
MSDVLLLHAALPGLEALPAAAELLARLPYARRLELERRGAAHRLAGLAGASRLRGRPADIAQLRFPAGGKPRFEGGPWFSISHSTTRVAVAVCERGEVGLDIEDAAGAGAREIERWTAIEAVLKATGAGLRETGSVRLDDDLRSAFFADRRVHLLPLALSRSCVARLAAFDELTSIAVEEVALPW